MTSPLELSPHPLPLCTFFSPCSLSSEGGSQDGGQCRIFWNIRENCRTRGHSMATSRPYTVISAGLFEGPLALRKHFNHRHIYNSVYWRCFHNTTICFHFRNIQGESVWAMIVCAWHIWDVRLFFILSLLRSMRTVYDIGYKLYDL